MLACSTACLLVLVEALVMLQWQTNCLFGISSSLCYFFKWQYGGAAEDFNMVQSESFRFFNKSIFFTSLSQVFVKRKLNCCDQYYILLWKDFISISQSLFS